MYIYIYTHIYIYTYIYVYANYRDRRLQAMDKMDNGHLFLETAVM